MTCPRCQEDLRQAQRMGVELDFCPRCRGVWLDGGEMEKLLERSRGDDLYCPEEFVERSAPPWPENNSTRAPEKKKKKGFFGELLDLLG